MVFVDLQFGLVGKAGGDDRGGIGHMIGAARILGLRLTIRGWQQMDPFGHLTIAGQIKGSHAGALQMRGSCFHRLIIANASMRKQPQGLAALSDQIWIEGVGAA